MLHIRRQLTLFVEKKQAESIEIVRHQFNPVQRTLINCHVTLCREDEIENLERVLINLSLLTQPEINISFGPATRFNHGKGVLLPANAENLEFQQLRRQILNGIEENPRNPEPHITLLHPRNATCTNEIFDEIESIHFPKKIRFKKISLIEQLDGGIWQTLQEFSLKKAPHISNEHPI